MFFSLSKAVDRRFPFSEQLGHWIFNHDPGWSNCGPTWYKGYNHRDIGHANFTKISLENDNIYLDHGDVRPYPLWWDQDHLVLTNLVGRGDRIWVDRDVILTRDNVSRIKKTIIADPCLDDLNLEQCCDILAHRFEAKAQALAGDMPDIDKKLFLSGGIDTLTIYALLRHTKVDHEVIDYDHVEYDWFTNCNLEQIRQNHWAYRQIHHWKKPTVLLTGSHGDEYMFRSPYTIALWAAWHDLDVVDLSQKNQGYHTRYFLQEKNMKIFQSAYQQREQIKRRFPSRKYLIKKIIDMHANDHQHWHLGNTLTWTPFKDLNLTEIILRLDVDSMIGHILNADVNRNLIQRFDSSALVLLSNQKNYHARHNLNCLAQAIS